MQENSIIHHETPTGEQTFHVIFERITSASPTDPNDTYDYIDILEDDGALAYMTEKEIIEYIKETI